MVSDKLREQLQESLDKTKREDRRHAIMAVKARISSFDTPTERDIELELQNIYFMSDLAEELYHEDKKKRKITSEEAQEYVESFTQDKREQGIMLWSLKKLYKMTAYAKNNIE